MEGVVAFHDREAAASLIRWWREAGVDTLVADEARDWLARPAQVAAAVPQPSAKTNPAPSHAPPTELPSTLPALLDWLRDSADVPEARWGRTRVLPAGDPQSDLMILIDAPDSGELMGGELGALFDKMLTAIGRDRGSIWLAPFATVRPVGRVPQRDFNRLADIARHHIGLVAPKRLLIMGDAPSRALLGTEVVSARGQTHSLNLDGATVEAVATHHPRLLNDRQTAKAQAWKDLQLLMKGL